jgi:hypothetical protein
MADEKDAGGDDLTPEQIKVLRSVLSSQATGQVLTEAQISALKAESEKFHRAQEQVAQALGVLWNAQLDIAVSMGQADRIT